MTLREAIDGLLAARAEIDAWDHDFTPAPYHLYTEATAALDGVAPAERERVVELFADRDAGVRREAASACAHWRLAAAHGALLAGLGDAVEEVRDAFAGALVAVGRETALASLAESSAKISKSVMLTAIDAAMQAFGARVLPLVERVDYAPDASLRERDAWWKLYDLDREAAGQVLARRVATARFDWVYGTAQLVRAKGGGDWVRPVFMNLVGHHEQSIATTAAEVLQRFGDASGIEPMLAAALQPGTHPWQRNAAIRSALELGRSTRTPVLARIAAIVRADEAEQETLLLALAGFADATWEPRALLEDLVRIGLRHASEKVVAYAIRAALALRFDSLAADVTATLGHRRWYANDMVAARDEYIKWAATSSLATQVAALERGLADGDTKALEIATNATHQIGRAPTGHAHVALVRRALASPHRDLRRAAASALAALGAREACDDLLAHARSGSPEEAADMIKALATLGDARAVDVSLARIGDVLDGAPIPSRPEPAWMCAAAVGAFGVFIADARAFDALRRSLTHVEMRMRRDAADAFRRAGDKRALPLLAPLLEDRDKQVRTAAKSAIEALGG